MPLLSRLINVLRRNRIDRELEEEMASHLEEAAEHGRSGADVRRAFGNTLHHRERSRDLKLLPWLDALASDGVFAWRQLNKRRAATVAAILSLGLAIGATTAVYRLVDALLLRPLPVAEPERLFHVATGFIDRDGRPSWRDEYDYPTFRRYRDGVAAIAELMVVGLNPHPGATVQIGDEPERAHRQFLSGNVFPIFGLRPALGRLFTPDDDRVKGGHPVAVLGYDYWKRRFSADPAIVGKALRIDNQRFEIVGVAPENFTGTEPGDLTDIFLPAMMNAAAIDSPGWSWFRIWAKPRHGVSPEQVRQTLHAMFVHERDQRLKTLHSDSPKQVIDNVLREDLMLFPAGRGASDLQKDYQRPLVVLGVLVALVLLIACANVGNLMTAQAAARAKEMALRVAIGAGRSRLVQLVLVESAMLAVFASAVGVAFARTAAPWIVSLLRMPEDPVRFVYDAGWRVWAFHAGLALVVTLLFGLAPALRASSVQPLAALKGGADPHTRQRSMNLLLAAQMAFCGLVLFLAGLFVATFDRLARRPLGFSHERVLVVDVSAPAEQSAAAWMQVAAQVRETPGVQSVAFAGWTLMTGNRWSMAVRVPGGGIKARSPYFLDISPGFLDTLRIALLDGRDFRPDDRPPNTGEDGQPAAPGVGIVNETFAREYFDGQNPVGRWMNVRYAKDAEVQLEIVGYVRDAVYGNLREPNRPTVFVPQMRRRNNTFLVRAAGPPAALAPLLRRRISEARPAARVRSIHAQSEYIDWQLLRERLLAALSMFFAAVALVLAAVGLYGVLNYSVTQQRREIGIRMALGARAGHVVRRVATRSVALVCLGLATGLAGGLAGARVVESLLFGVKPADWDAIAAPALTLLAAAAAAAVPPAIRAVRTDPARTLRSE